MAELAGLIGRFEAPISRGPFPQNMPGARVLPCSKSLEGPTGASPHLDWTRVMFLQGFTWNMGGGRVQRILPFVHASFLRRERLRTKASSDHAPPPCERTATLPVHRWFHRHPAFLASK